MLVDHICLLTGLVFRSCEISKSDDNRRHRHSPLFTSVIVKDSVIPLGPAVYFDRMK